MHCSQQRHEQSVKRFWDADASLQWGPCNGVPAMGYVIPSLPPLLLVSRDQPFAQAVKTRGRRVWHGVRFMACTTPRAMYVALHGLVL